MNVQNKIPMKQLQKSQRHVSVVKQIQKDVHVNKDFLPGCSLARLGEDDLYEGGTKLKILRNVIGNVKTNISNSTNFVYQNNLVGQTNKSQIASRKGRAKEDESVQQLKRLFEDPEFQEKHPEQIEKLLKGNQQLEGLQSGRRKTHKRSLDFQIKDQSAKSQNRNTLKAIHRQNQLSQDVTQNQKISHEEQLILNSKRDLSFLKLIKKIQDSVRILKASRSGKSVFNTTSFRQSQNSEGIPNSQQNSVQIPIFQEPQLKEQFTKLLSLGGPNETSNLQLVKQKIEERKFSQNSRIQNDPQFKSYDNWKAKQASGLPQILSPTNANNPFSQTQHSQMVVNVKKDLTAKNSPFPSSVTEGFGFNQPYQFGAKFQPPIGLTNRTSPKELRQRFAFPEFHKTPIYKHNVKSVQKSRKDSRQILSTNPFSQPTMENPYEFVNQGSPKPSVSKRQSILIQVTPQKKRSHISIDYGQSFPNMRPVKTIGTERIGVINQDTNDSIQIQQHYSTTKQSTIGNAPVNIQQTYKRHNYTTGCQLPSVLQFCKKENLPFTDSEKVLFDLNLTKKNHRLYTKALKYCFRDTSRGRINGDELSIDLAFQSSQQNSQQISRMQRRDDEKATNQSIEQKNRNELKLNTTRQSMNVDKLLYSKKNVVSEYSYREYLQKQVFNELEHKLDNPTCSETIKAVNKIKQIGKQKAIGKLSNLDEFKKRFSEWEKNNSPGKKSEEKLEFEDIDLVQREILKKIQKGYKLDAIFKAKKKYKNAKNKMSKDLIKVLEKVDLDRPMQLKDKAQVIFKADTQTEQVSASRTNAPYISRDASQNHKQMQTLASMQEESLSVGPLAPAKMRNEEQSIAFKKIQNRKKIESQKLCYLQLLDYLKLRFQKDKTIRVTEEERKVFETLKIIFDGSWIVSDAEEYVNILREIEVLDRSKVSEQLYFFLWYSNQLLSFDSLALDRVFEKELDFGVEFARRKKQIIDLLKQQIQF